MGPTQYAFIEYNYANQFISALPEMPQDIAIGSGFGIDNGFYIKFGSTLSGSERQHSLYFSSYIPIKEKFVVEPLLRFNNGNTFMLGAHYRFGKSMLKSKGRN